MTSSIFSRVACWPSCSSSTTRLFQRSTPKDLYVNACRTFRSKRLEGQSKFKKTETKNGNSDGLGPSEAVIGPSKSAKDMPNYKQMAQKLDLSEGSFVLNRSLKDMLKPTLFTIGFCGTCMVGSVIWRENSKIEARDKFREFFNQQKDGWNYDFGYRREKVGGRDQVHELWMSLSPGQTCVLMIALANTAVYLMWKSRVLKPLMDRFFLSSPYSRHDCQSLVFSVWSHKLFLHLAVNMLVLNSFAPMVIDDRMGVENFMGFYMAAGHDCQSLVFSVWSHKLFLHLAVNMLVLNSFAPMVIDDRMGVENFMGFYMAAGVISSLAAVLYKVVKVQLGFSLGASGAILGLMGYTLVKYPDLRLNIIFLPFFTFSSFQALMMLLTLDGMGLLLGWRLFDHAAHLGGTLFGIWYAYYGEQLVERCRPTIIQWYNEMKKEK